MSHWNYGYCMNPAHKTYKYQQLCLQFFDDKTLVILLAIFEYQHQWLGYSEINTPDNKLSYVCIIIFEYGHQQ